jgi:hypothetical protein
MATSVMTATPNTASLVSVVGLLGVMAGALVVGTVSDYIWAAPRFSDSYYSCCQAACR